MRSNREYDYFGNVLEYEYDYFPSYSSTSMSTQKVLLLEYEYKYTSTITPSPICACVMLLVQGSRVNPKGMISDLLTLGSSWFCIIASAFGYTQ